VRFADALRNPANAAAKPRIEIILRSPRRLYNASSTSACVLADRWLHAGITASMSAARRLQG
jgi:hypothetical protein